MEKSLGFFAQAFWKLFYIQLNQNTLLFHKIFSKHFKLSKKNCSHCQTNKSLTLVKTQELDFCIWFKKSNLKYSHLNFLYYFGLKARCYKIRIYCGAHWGPTWPYIWYVGVRVCQKRNLYKYCSATPIVSRRYHKKDTPLRNYNT